MTHESSEPAIRQHRSNIDDAALGGYDNGAESEELVEVFIEVYELVGSRRHTVDREGAIAIALDEDLALLGGHVVEPDPAARDRFPGMVSLQRRRTPEMVVAQLTDDGPGARTDADPRQKIRIHKTERRMCRGGAEALEKEP